MKKILLGMMAAGLLMAGCGGTKEVVKQEAAPEAAMAASDGRPDWVLKGDGAFKDEKGTVVYGVGIADSGPNLSLKREKADSRARADMAAQLKIAVQKLTLDYMSDHKDYFDKNTAGSDEMTTVVTKSVVDQVLLGSKIADRWEDPKTNALYSLARMEIGNALYDSYEQALKRSLRSQHRLETEERMNDALDKLDQEVGRQRRRETDILGVVQQAPQVPGSMNK